MVVAVNVLGDFVGDEVELGGGSVGGVAVTTACDLVVGGDGGGCKVEEDDGGGSVGGVDGSKFGGNGTKEHTEEDVVAGGTRLGCGPITLFVRSTTHAGASVVAVGIQSSTDVAGVGVGSTGGANVDSVAVVAVDRDIAGDVAAVVGVVALAVSALRKSRRALSEKEQSMSATSFIFFRCCTRSWYR